MLRLPGLTWAAYRDTAAHLSTVAPPAHGGAPAGCDEPLIFSASSRPSTTCWPGVSLTDLSSRRSRELRGAFSLVRPGLMVVTSAGLRDSRGHREVGVAAISGGADAVQLRAPELSDRDLLPVAVDLAFMCRAAAKLLIVNNRLEVAVAASGPGTIRRMTSPDPGSSREDSTSACNPTHSGLRVCSMFARMSRYHAVSAVRRRYCGSGSYGYLASEPA
jgi:hypothetical protein